MSENLKDIAAKMKEEHELAAQKVSGPDTPEEFEETDVVEENFDDDDEEDAAVVIGTVGIGNTAGVAKFATLENAIDDDDDEEFTISDEELRAEMPNLDDVGFEHASSKIREEIEQYRKDLILKSGFTIAEADEAARNRVKKLGKEENDAYLEENPEIGIVEINKKDAKNLEFTDEEQEKLRKVKAIKLRVIEETDLKTIDIERVDAAHKSAMIHSVDMNLSQYSIPLPLMNDFCRFRGSQTIQLIQAVRYNDATLDEVISKKSTLVYNQLVSSANIQKFDENGKIKMSQNEFENRFLFHDLDMALYGILVASSMETLESTFRCGKCNKPFQWTYNLKTLLNLDDVSDQFKQKIDEILGHKADTEYLQAMYEKDHKSVRVESPITKNRYDLNYPTIARAIQVFRSIDQENEQEVYLAAIALFIHKMYVYNHKTGKYIDIDETEQRTLMDTLMVIPQTELDIIQEFLKPYLYSPKFILHTKCDKCGHKMVNSLSVDDMVFLKARDSSTEIA